jgi:hypothetical protein
MDGMWLQLAAESGRQGMDVVATLKAMWFVHRLCIVKTIDFARDGCESWMNSCLLVCRIDKAELFGLPLTLKG